MLKEEESESTIILFGHSLGSFAAQQYVLDRSEQSMDSILSARASRRTRATRNSRPAQSNILNLNFEPARLRSTG
jgi:malonyl CoA-acyl carrier protein transacylase